MSVWTCSDFCKDPNFHPHLRNRIRWSKQPKYHQLCFDPKATLITVNAQNQHAWAKVDVCGYETKDSKNLSDEIETFTTIDRTKWIIRRWISGVLYHVSMVVVALCCGLHCLKQQQLTVACPAPLLSGMSWSFCCINARMWNWLLGKCPEFSGRQLSSVSALTFGRLPNFSTSAPKNNCRKNF